MMDSINQQEFGFDVAKGIPINTFELAKVQWTLLNALENEYIGRTVFGFKDKFEDVIWFAFETFSDQRIVNWETMTKDFGDALKILMKVVTFDWIETHRLVQRTVTFKLYKLKNSIISLIISKRLLAGDRGQFCLGLNHISDEDLLMMLDSRIFLASSESAFLQECSEIAQFIKFANNHSKKIPLFEITARLPWDKAGISIKTWANKRSEDLNQMFPISEGFVPLSSECVQPLIETSLNMILNLGEYFNELGELLRSYKCDQLYKGPPPNQILEKYGKIFREISPPPDIKEMRSTKVRVSAVYIWIRKLIFLARTACINIILLTTGLRNSDVRGLKAVSCSPSGRVDMLYYMKAYLKKTKNFIQLPVPYQTFRAIELLKAIKFTSSEYLIDAIRFTKVTYDLTLDEKDSRIGTGDSLNYMLRYFAEHFKIPFKNPETDDLYSAHNYRTTVAGWLDAHSNLSILLVRRLFGHSNDVMPTSYLRNNPAFIQERKEQKLRTAIETSRQMALAVSQGKVAGTKGEELNRGYKSHLNRLENDPNKSHSLTDAELVLSFAQIIEQRILNESLCGFLTPFGVRCMRNPSDSSPPPCAMRSQRHKTLEIAEEILEHINLVDPQNCIGGSCDQALLGPWSETILNTLLWHADLLSHKFGDAFTDEHFRIHAISFIRQYAPAIKKIFKIEVFDDGKINRDQANV